MCWQLWDDLNQTWQGWTENWNNLLLCCNCEKKWCISDKSQKTKLHWTMRNNHKYRGTRPMWPWLTCLMVIIVSSWNKPPFLPETNQNHMSDSICSAHMLTAGTRVGFSTRVTDVVPLRTQQTQTADHYRPAASWSRCHQGCLDVIRPVLSDSNSKESCF